jgi:hypothetical protein
MKAVVIFYYKTKSGERKNQVCVSLDARLSLDSMVKVANNHLRVFETYIHDNLFYSIHQGDLKHDGKILYDLSQELKSNLPTTQRSIRSGWNRSW